MTDTLIRATFYPGGRTALLRPGMTLIEAAARAGLVINTPCGGAGTCGKCRVRFDGAAPQPGAVETARLAASEIDQGWRLACQTRLSADGKAHVPRASLFGGRHQIQTASDHDGKRAPDGEIRRIPLEMPPPDMSDAAPDMTRMERALTEALPDWNPASDALFASPDVLRVLGARLRATGFKGAAILRGARLIDYEAVDAAQPLYALAFDIGTTTVAAALLDIETGEEQGVVSTMNPQTAYGDDVLSRIAYAGRDDAALRELQGVILDAVRGSVERLCDESGADARRICNVVFTGNTTMQHLLCGFNPTALGAAPFVSLHKRGVALAASELGLTLHPEAEAYIFPVVGGFVGGDTIAGLLAADMAHAAGPALMVDIGTNGEIVLMHEGVLRAASTAAGPAFEGARISGGMRATNGAIETVTYTDDLEFSVIGGGAPTGLCGSGLIDLCGALLRVGVLRNDGRLLVGDELGAEVPEAIRQRMRTGAQGEPECVLHVSDGAALTFTQRDVREVQLGAGAIRAGIGILLKQAGIAPDDLKQVLIAGGFGSFIRRDNAQRIGLIPHELPHDSIRFAGNTAFSGAKWVAVSRAARRDAEALSARVVHVELNQDPDFAMEFALAMQFPGS